ncbi:MAG: endonuclease/exonuclease/phosphatase family protein, partial [Anaerolineaceae bacterium]|nr:endonuclease/exonuclease/phosphatase family protein [Anaerolineaceae bacterium]
LVITIEIPENGIERIEAYNDGLLVENTLTWKIPGLSGNGDMVSVSFDTVANGEEQYLVFNSYQASAAEWPDPVSGPTIYTFIGSSVPVWAIQGTAFRSPYVMDKLTTSGVVTGVFPELLGFWIQSSDTDDNPLTSEGLFIKTNEIDLDVKPGDFIEVGGIVHESHQETQLHIENTADIEVIDSGYELPGAIELDPPIDEVESAVYYEALEGMLVQVSDTALCVSPTNKYGEASLVLAYHDIARLWQGQQNGIAIMIDDGRSITHSDQSTMNFTLVTGDEISGILGPLAYNYGNYKIEPITSPAIKSKDYEAPQLPMLKEDEFSLMTWNVENLFDYNEPHPSDLAMPNLRSYKLDLAKIANTIIAAGVPTIIALQEVENLGILEDLAEHELLIEYDFQSVLIEGTDSRGIDVGYLVRGDQARIIDVQQHPAPEGITSRPPLLIEVEIQTTSNPVSLFVINNHFTSMSGGEEATEPRRIAQASWNAIIVEEILSKNPDGYLAVAGDLNSYIESPPIDTLRAAGLIHVFEELPRKDSYTYIYQGISQTLDHILITPSLMGLLETVEVLHVNADFPPPLPEDESASHKSDHDPVITIFQWTE